MKIYLQSEICNTISSFNDILFSKNKSTWLCLYRQGGHNTILIQRHTHSIFKENISAAFMSYGMRAKYSIAIDESANT